MIELYSKGANVLLNRFKLEMSAHMRQELLAHARAELPNECCGLIAGRIEPPGGEALSIGQAIRRFPLINQAASSTEFLSEPASLFGAVREIHRLKLEILAVYHSHPTTEPIPSRKDRELHFAAESMCLIISPDFDPAIRAWWLLDKRAQPAELRIV